MLVDTHAHLNFRNYKDDLKKVIERALAAGVKKIVCASSNLADSRRAVELAGEYPEIILAAAGIHPQQTDPKNKENIEDQLENLEGLISKGEVAAVGECGLDFSPAPPRERDRSGKEQIALFRGQIVLAKKYNLPLLIHSRKAFGETVSVLEEFDNLKGVFHCYAGGKKGVEKVRALGFYFGIDGNLTYDEGLQSVFGEIEIEEIVLETDAPFLAPASKRGERNEPAYLGELAAFLAQLKGISISELEEVTTKNAKTLLGIG